MTDRDRRPHRGDRRPSAGSSGARQARAAPAGRGTNLAILLGLCLVVAATAAGASTRADEAPSFRVVVHPDNPQSVASREFVSDIFLKKTSRWSSGETLHPVDLRFGSAVREAFSQSILRRSAAAVRNYWQQRIFTGRGVPPPEVESDADVIRYVGTHAGGIGYVSMAADPSAVKVLSIR